MRISAPLIHSFRGFNKYSSLTRERAEESIEATRAGCDCCPVGIRKSVALALFFSQSENYSAPTLLWSSACILFPTRYT